MRRHYFFTMKVILYEYTARRLPFAGGRLRLPTGAIPYLYGNDYVFHNSGHAPPSLVLKTILYRYTARRPPIAGGRLRLPTGVSLIFMELVKFSIIRDTLHRHLF